MLSTSLYTVKFNKKNQSDACMGCEGGTVGSCRSTSEREIRIWGMLTFPDKGFVDKGRETMVWGMDSIVEVEVGALSE